MSRVKLRGMTWNHRRAIDPLVGTMPMFQTQYPHIEIEWLSQPLSGFEFASVAQLARDYDLVIFDHPFAGAISKSRSLLPLDAMLSNHETAFVGPSLETYRMQGELWAIPVDAACQVSVSRPDLMERLDAAIPRNWNELLKLGEMARARGMWLAIALKGVHSLMTFFTLMANLGSPCATSRDHSFAERHEACEALSLMRELLRLAPPEVLGWNSIALHDQMLVRDDLAFCPAVYCYATYAEAGQRRPLRFHNLPGPMGFRGSTIGGAGLGVSAFSRYQTEALNYARFAAELATQRAFADFHGQPARVEVWEDEDLNQKFAGGYKDTRATMDASWIRPRYDGYLAFQEAGGNLIESHLRGELGEAWLLDELQRLHAQG